MEVNNSGLFASIAGTVFGSPQAGAGSGAPVEKYEAVQLPGDCCRSGQCVQKKDLLKTLQQRDQEVRTHEAAHLKEAGGFALSGPIYEFKTGPDGRSYVVEGKVMIDTSEIKGDPRATLLKMKQVERAARAPGCNLSGADLACAAKASSLAGRAEKQIAQQG